jgi:GMP reductase
MRIENEILLDYSDVLIRPKRSTLTSRKDVELTRKFVFRNYVPDFPENIEDIHYYGVPIMAANMDGVGTFAMATKLAKQGIFTCLVKTYSKEELTNFFINASYDITASVAMSIGTSNADYDKFVQVYARVGSKLKYLCIDVANGYTEAFVSHIRNIRKIYPHIVIIAGNVVTADQTQELILNGADIVKVGIGPGSVCTTRIQTGVGYPQLSAVIECADAAHGLGGHIIADGGCTCPGDVAKAFASGADFVMLGSMLAGTDQGGGEVINRAFKTGEIHYDTGEEVVEAKQFVQFYGMSSETANNKHFGGLKNYRSSEGRTVLIPYKGNVENTIQDLLGGIRSTCTYVGASTLKQLSKCTTFVRVNNQFNRTYESTTTKL